MGARRCNVWCLLPNFASVALKSINMVVNNNEIAFAPLFAT